MLKRVALVEAVEIGAAVEPAEVVLEDFLEQVSEVEPEVFLEQVSEVEFAFAQ